ncbi:HD domain-containing protein [Vibrio sp. CAIM 722]|uniref:HD domain-containing protein n=1 Tax=Vibrio eleionomae TaxID=2653505 RepID=A0A7X4RUC4_9VIBR|nr:ABC transporter substrate binding protein [Vibrio eleionomae]MZI92934.1 HD domain-containing protein [Vibrio eleionomae]
MDHLSFRLKLFICISVIFNSVTFSVFAAGSTPSRILVLHSYSPSYAWTRELQKGIEDVSHGTNVKLSIEYLDTKRIFNADYLASVRHYFEKKYRGYPFNGIIISDDNALKFFNSLDMDNLKNLPTAAVGINNFQAELSSKTQLGTIIYEKDRIAETIQLIAKLRPKLKNLYYLADHSPTSNLIELETKRILQHYPNIHLIEVRDLPLKDAATLLEKASPNDAVLLTHYNTEIENNVYHDYNQVAEQIGNSSRAPVFVFWKFYIHDGVLGGSVTDSYQLGSLAANLVIHQLNGMPIDNAQMASQGYRNVFDFNALLKHAIDKSLLPSNRVLIGEPQSFVREHLRLVLIVSSIFAVLVIIIFVLILSLRRKKIISQQNQKILQLQKKTVGVQKELIHLLGDAIETRSGETGNHVKRVAKMSALLASITGLSPNECEVIEVVSPMHDIGKIGIPESILEKPGKLDPDEWEIMKGHVDIGYKILSASEGEFLDYAAIIALEHHERWDGAGYPLGKSGENIHLYARITTIVDVFDALLSVRCYKPAWPIERVIDLLIVEKGKQFDPQLTQLVLDNIDDFVAIRQQYPDVATFHMPNNV